MADALLRLLPLDKDILELGLVSAYLLPALFGTLLQAQVIAYYWAYAVSPSLLTTVLSGLVLLHLRVWPHLWALTWRAFFAMLDSYQIDGATREQADRIASALLVVAGTECVLYHIPVSVAWMIWRDVVAFSIYISALSPRGLYLLRTAARFARTGHHLLGEFASLHLIGAVAELAVVSALLLIVLSLTAGLGRVVIAPLALVPYLSLACTVVFLFVAMLGYRTKEIVHNLIKYTKATLVLHQSQAAAVVIAAVSVACTRLIASPLPTFLVGAVPSFAAMLLSGCFGPWHVTRLSWFLACWCGWLVPVLAVCWPHAALWLWTLVKWWYWFDLIRDFSFPRALIADSGVPFPSEPSRPVKLLLPASELASPEHTLTATVLARAVTQCSDMYAPETSGRVPSLQALAAAWAVIHHHDEDAGRAGSASISELSAAPLAPQARHLLGLVLSLLRMRSGRGTVHYTALPCGRVMDRAVIPGPHPRVFAVNNATALWANDRRTGVLLHEIEHGYSHLVTDSQSRVSALCFVSPNGVATAAAASDSGFHIDYSIRVWRMPSGECTAVLTGHQDYVLTLTQVPRHVHLLASVDGTATLKLWNVEMAVCMATIVLPLPSPLSVFQPRLLPYLDPDSGGAKLALCCSSYKFHTTDQQVFLLDAVTLEFDDAGLDIVCRDAVVDASIIEPSGVLGLLVQRHGATFLQCLPLGAGQRMLLEPLKWRSSALLLTNADSPVIWSVVPDTPLITVLSRRTQNQLRSGLLRIINIVSQETLVQLHLPDLPYSAGTTLVVPDAPLGSQLQIVTHNHTDSHRSSVVKRWIFDGDSYDSAGLLRVFMSDYQSAEERASHP